MLTPTEVDVLRRTLEYVLAHPEEYSQTTWGYRELPCQTVFCVAGHAAVTVGGATPVWLDGDDLDCVIPAGTTARVAVSDHARWLLGLRNDQALHLFSGGNSLRRVAELALLYSGGRVDVIDRVPSSDRDVEVEWVDSANSHGPALALNAARDRVDT